jgi:hypothetical protein
MGINPLFGGAVRSIGVLCNGLWFLMRDVLDIYNKDILFVQQEQYKKRGGKRPLLLML